MARGGTIRGARTRRRLPRPRRRSPATTGGRSPGLDRLDDKSFAARRNAIAPCRRKRSASMTEAAQPRAPAARHDQRRALAIVRQRLRPQRQRDQAAAGRLRHAADVVAGDAVGERGVRRPLARRHPPPAIPSARNRDPCRCASDAAFHPGRGRRHCGRRRRPGYPAAAPAPPTPPPASTSTAPDQRSGVRNSPSRMMPRLAAISGPMPNAAIRPTAPGNAATHCVTAIIQSMPTPMIPRTRRRNRTASRPGRAGPPASPPPRPPASPRDWPARHRA